MASNREIIGRWVQATCAADPHALSQLLASDATVIDEPSSTRYIGPRGYLDYVTAWTDALTMEVEENFTRPDGPAAFHVSFAVRLTHVGVFRSKWGDAPPTGKRFSLTIDERCTVQHGQLAELRVIYNLLALLKHVGLRP